VIISDNIINDVQGTVAGIEIGASFDWETIDFVMTISGNVLQNCNQSMNLEGTFGISLLGNNIRNSTNGYGIKLYGSGHSCSGNVIVNCWGGIWMPNGANSTVMGNVVGNCSSMGIGLSPDYGGDQGDFIDCVIMGNRIWGCANGIWLNTTCTYNTIIGCDTRECTNGIIDLGSNNHVNLCWNGTTWIS